MATQPVLDFPDPLPDRVLEAVRNARNSGLKDCLSDVLDLLVDHPSGPRAGRSLALSIAEMQRLWRRRGQHVWNERTVKEAAKTLLEQHEIPIGSSRASGSSGYYIVLEGSDAESTVRVWGAEITSLARRCHALSPKSQYVRELLGQLSVKQG